MVESLAMNNFGAGFNNPVSGVDLHLNFPVAHDVEMKLLSIK